VKDGFMLGGKPVSVEFNPDGIEPFIVGRTVLLNLNDSATSSGSINSWSFCYIILDPDEISDDVYVGVWRPTNNGYSLVTESLTLLPKSSFRDFDFVCLKHSVSSHPIKVLEGDVLGMIVNAVPTVLSALGSDQEGLIWAGSFPQGAIIVTDLVVIPNYTLYLKGLEGMYI
jgi:hypothetical protein